MIKIIILLFSVSCVYSQDFQTENTLTLNKNNKQHPTKIAEMSWLSGKWVSRNNNQFAEEVWSSVESTGMMGMFRMIVDGKVVFYEICQIIEIDKSLILRLKHFDSNLIGWEEKEQTIDFPLIKIEKQTAWFSGITYQRIDNELTVWVAMKQKDGSFEEATFKFSKNE